VSDAPLAGESYHLLGITGRGMAPVAIVAQYLGAVVTGCDRSPRIDTSPLLAAAGVDFDVGHSPTHLSAGATLVHTSVASLDEPEMVAALSAGSVWHRTDLLARVLRAHPGAGITGSHGKGTVAALATGALEAAGRDPLALLGAPVPALGGVVRLGRGPMVAEVDDSDLTVRRVESQVAVVTNLDQDHPHLAIPLAHSVEAIGEFVSRAGKCVVLGPSPRADALEARANVVVWRWRRDFHAQVVGRADGRTELELRGPGGERARGTVRLIGPRTAENAAVAFATALALDADSEAAAHGLGVVDRIERRLEPVGIRDGVHVFDDFGAKHPVNVREGIAALRRHFPDARIIAGFEAYGGYLQMWGHRFARALSGADQVVVAPAAWSADYDELSLGRQTWPAACSAPVSIVDSREAAAAELMATAAPGDVVVVFAQLHVGRRIARVAAGLEAP
jgi:UDP-N-acetylmuramate--alanine ligase